MPSFRRKHSPYIRELVAVTAGPSLKDLSPHNHRIRQQYLEDGSIIPMANLEVSGTVDDSLQSMYLEFEADDCV